MGTRAKLSRFVGLSSLFCLATTVMALQLAPSKDSSKRIQPGQPAPKASPKKAPEKRQQDANESGDYNIGKVTTQTVLIPTTVTDKGNYVNGLKIEDFQLFDNGKLQKIASDFSYQPLSLVLAVQTNRDVGGMLPKMKNAGVLLHGLVTGQTGDIAVLTFDHRVQLLQDFTSNGDRLDDSMQKITVGTSNSRLIDAIVKADQMLVEHDRNGQRRRVILLLSHNEDKGSKAHLAETARQMQFDNIVVYSVNISQFLSLMTQKPQIPRPAYGGVPAESTPSTPNNGPQSETTIMQNQQLGNLLEVGAPAFRGVRDVFKKTPAEALTSLTGGRVYSFRSNVAMENAITDIGKELHSQYLLSYSPSAETRTEPGFHTIKVVVNRPELQIRMRPGYWWGGGKMQ